MDDSEPDSDGGDNEGQMEGKTGPALDLVPEKRTAQR